MTYPEALSYLGEARRFGMKLGLDPMRYLAKCLGDPQKQLRFIHLAGTNGKGSTAAFCESCLRESGYRVGLYTSPHLVSVRERIQIDRAPISQTDFVLGMIEVREATKIKKQEPTFFEILTALALWYFAREKVEWVVWETGLGGRLDATNIVDPDVCIITNIGLEHQQYLGGTLVEIAGEKAGIIKQNVPVVTAVAPGRAREVILNEIKKKKCLSFISNSDESKNLGLRDGKQWALIETDREEYEFALGLIGEHQIENAACAVAAMDQIRNGHAANFKPSDPYKITFESVTHGLENAVWPGRFDVLSEEPLIVLDGAHNPAGMKKLIETWRSFLTTRKIDFPTHLVFGSVADKDISEMAGMLRPLVSEVSLVRLVNERTADPAELAKSFSGLPCTLYDSVTDLWQKLEEANSASPVLITGSLFLVGEMLARRQGDAGEYALNERLEKFSAKQ
jgi:dihydrofolate synthase/folylpolyglutamate synthase